MSESKQETNPFYALVILSGVAFAVTTLAYTLALAQLQSPTESLATDSGPSPVFQFFEKRGESLMLWEAGALTVTALLAMGLDRWRSWRASRNKGEISGQNL